MAVTALLWHLWPERSLCRRDDSCLPGAGFLRVVKIGDTITCRSVVSRKVDRGGLRLMNTDITVTNQNQEQVLTGKVGFVLPEPLNDTQSLRFENRP